MRWPALLAAVPAAIILSLPIACQGRAVAGTASAARADHPAFHEAVWVYYASSHPICGVKTDTALEAKIAGRDKRFSALSARIEAGQLGGEFRRALDDAQKKQAGIAAVADCAAPTLAASREGFNQSLVALDKLERAWRAALKGQG